MYDEETGSWWQQVSGECLLGPLKGGRLALVPSEEVTLSVWRTEHPGSRIVRFDARYLHRYEASNWEERIAGLPIAGEWDARSPLAPRDLVVGIEWAGQAAAYPLAAVRQFLVLPHRIGAEPVIVVLGPDGRTVRAFSARVEGRPLDFFRRAQEPFALLDQQTGTEWDFMGRARSGPLEGKQLDRIQNRTEYWFDWKRYHPATLVYRPGR